MIIEESVCAELLRGCEEVLPEEGLRKKIAER